MDKFSEVYRDKSLRLFKENHELKTLLDITNIISSSLSIQTILSLILEKTLDLLKYKAGFVHILEGPDEIKGTSIHKGIPDEVINQLSGTELSSRIFKKVVDKKRIHVEKDPSLNSKIIDISIKKQGWKLGVFVPLRFDDDVIGIMCILNIENIPPTHLNLDILDAIGLKMAQAVHNATCLADREDLNKRFYSLLDSSKSLAYYLDIEEVLFTISRNALEMVPSADFSALFLYDPALNRLILRSYSGLSDLPVRAPSAARPSAERRQIPAQAETQRGPSPLKIKVRLGESLIGEVFESGKPALINQPKAIEEGLSHISNELWSHLNKEATLSPGSLIVAPLSHKHNTLGCLCLFKFDADRHFSRTDLDLIAAFAHSGAITIENINNHEKLHHQLKKTQALERVSEWINSELNLRLVLNAVVESSREVLDTMRHGIFLEHKTGKVLECAFSRGLSKGLIKSICQNFRRFEGARIISHRHPVVVFDTQSDPRLESFRILMGHEQVRSIVSLPLRVGSKSLGFFIMFRNEPHLYSEEDMHLANSFANQAAIAIENSILYQEALEFSFRLTQKAQDLSLYREIVARVIASLDTEKFIKTVLEIAKKVIDADIICLALFEDDARKVLHIRGMDYLGEINLRISESLPINKPLAGRVIKGKKHIIHNTSSGSAPLYYSSYSRRLDIQSCLLIPLKVRDKTVGILSWESTKGNRFNETHLPVAIDLATFAALALEQSRLYKELNALNKRLEAKQSIDKTIHSVVKLDDIIESISARIGSILPHDLLTVSLMDKATNTFRVAFTASRYRTLVREGEAVPREDPLYKDIMEKKVPISYMNLEDVDNLSQIGLKLLQDGIRSLLVIPLFKSGGLIGLLKIGSMEKNIFLEGHVSIAVDLANQISIAVNNSLISQELKDKKHLISTVLANSPNGVMILDANMQTIEFNDTASELTGLKREDVLGTSGVLIFPEEEMDKINMEWDNALKSEGGHIFEGSIFTNAGELIPVSVSLSVLKDDEGCLLGSIWIITDLREQKKAEERLIKSSHLNIMGEIAVGITHDLNNLLTSITGKANLLLGNFKELPKGKAIKGDELISAIKAILKASSDGTRMVTRIRDLAGPKGEEREDEYVGIDINALIKEVRKQTRVKWSFIRKTGKIAFETHLDDVPLIRGIPYQIRELFTNLIFNAVDAIPDDGKINIITRFNTKESDWVDILIRDTGKGIPGEKREKVFEPFFSTKGKRGWGMGLTVVRDIVTSHHGTITINPARKKGSEFKVRLPVWKDTGNGKEEGTRPQIKKGVKSSNNILVIDDDEEVLNILTDLLRLEGYNVKGTSNGMEGLRILQSTQGTKRAFDLLITDLELSDVTGWEIAHEAKRIDHSLRVAIISGWGDTYIKEEWGAIIDLIISKPFAHKKMISSIGDILGTSKRK